MSQRRWLLAIVLLMLVLLPALMRLEQQSLPTIETWDTKLDVVSRNNHNNNTQNSTTALKRREFTPGSNASLFSSTSSTSFFSSVNVKNSTLYNTVDRPTDGYQRAIRQYFQAIHGNNTTTIMDTQWIQDYLYWHDEMRRQYPDVQLFDHPQAPNVAIMYMDPAKHHGGLADRVKGMGHLLKLCHKEKRIVLLKWYDTPLQLEAFVVPHLLNWTVPNHPSTSTPELLRASFDNINEQVNQRVKLIRFTNQLGNYLSPFGVIWHAYFQPSEAVRGALDEARTTLGLIPGQYDAIHCRLGHPAYNNRKSYKSETDKDMGYNFQGINKARAMNTAVDAIACSQWLAQQQQQEQVSNNHYSAVVPVYFYSDSPDLVQAVLNPNQTEVAGAEQQAAAVALSHWTTTNKDFPIIGRQNAPIAHLERPVVTGNNQSTSVQAYASTFVDLYLAIDARCITLGVGRFAYLAAKISGTTCWTRHQTPANDVSALWGMKNMIREIPQCPVHGKSAAGG